jgi:hypothetical protein
VADLGITGRVWTVGKGAGWRGSSTYKSCGCHTEDGRRIGDTCPKLRRKGGAWNPFHGTWHGRAELPAAADGSRVELRAGGWDKEADLTDWFDDALRLMSIRAPAPEGYEDRDAILELIRQIMTSYVAGIRTVWSPRRARRGST